MPARDLMMIKTRTQLRAAATNRQRVRVRGVVGQRAAVTTAADTGTSG